MSGIERIAAERTRQIEQEGWSAEHDDEYGSCELVFASSCYAMMADVLNRTGDKQQRAAMAEEAEPPAKWPWDGRWWKPSQYPIRNLEKAGALIAAEIDRLERIRSRS